MEKTKIEWCDSSWNPITGCLHNCPYCYARAIANRFGGCDIAPDGTTDQQIVVLKERLKATKKSGKIINAAYPYGFTPTLHEYRLKDPTTKGFGKTIFVCSTADMFGKWVPDEWIQKVFDACKTAMNHRYLFLTKNPERYIELATKGMLPSDDNFWYGTTVTDPDMPAFHSQIHHTFLSIEPIQKPFGRAGGQNPLPGLVEWAIFGAETGNRKDKVIPNREWIEDAVQGFKDRGKPVFMKNSMIPVWGDDILTELPWKTEVGENGKERIP